MRLLVVEDEAALAAVLERVLHGAGYRVEVVGDGATALDYVASIEFDLVVLDVMLPHRNGFEVLDAMRRARSTARVLLLTARGDTDSKVRGLDLGADDYLTKPFELPELLARVRALLRRDAIARSGVLSAADLTLDPSTRAVTRAGRAIDLTAREYQLLELLLRNKNRVLGRDAIFDRIWAREFSGTLKVVDVYVNYLRGKIDRDFTDRLIHTVRGIGYALREPHHDADE